MNAKNMQKAAFVLACWDATLSSLACPSGPRVLPPPGPHFDLKATEQTIWMGTVAAVEESLDQNWLSRRFIAWGLAGTSSAGGLTPLHPVTLSNAVQAGDASAWTEPRFEMSGCSIKIPRIGQRAIFFVSKTDPSSQPLPLYDSDEQLFNAWLRVIARLLPSTPPAAIR